MRVKFAIRDATPEDAEWFAPRLRASDQLELEAASGPDIAQTLRTAVAISPICKVCEFAGEPVLLLGCAEPPGLGVPWLVGTERATRHPTAMTQVGVHFTELFLTRRPLLMNCVDVRNAASIRWLRRLGFTIHDPVVFGRNGERFHPFTLGG